MPKEEDQIMLLPLLKLAYIIIYDSAGPHANANRHHVSNEIRMLERFG